MKTHFIVSMGTSIKTNYKFASHEELRLQSPPQQAQRPGHCQRLPAPRDFFDSDAAYHHICEILKNPINQGAEQQTISAVLRHLQDQHQECQEIEYHLVSTDTNDCIFCATFLGHEILSRLSLSPEIVSVTYHIPNGLSAANDEHFPTRGLPNLLSCLAEILDAIDAQGEQAILIPTGGYKAIIPYLVIASILYKKPAYYMYERTNEVLELPTPPLSVNTPEFRSVLVLLENIINVRKEEGRAYYEAIPKAFQPLVYLTEEERYAYTAFGSRLKQMFDGDVRSPLVIRASANSLVPRLGAYQQRFLNITRLGESVWLGDKAPEMADHARHHHEDLFAYAELLLLPIFRSQPDFLSPAELFLLLGTIYLHDCGHAMSAFPAGSEQIPLLASEIRTYHNVLGYLRLQNQRGFQAALERLDIAIDAHSFENIATLSVYHRRRMPLLRGSKAYESPDGRVFPPLQERELAQDGEVISGDRLLLLAALFRIIDGMDKQVERAGDAAEIAMKAEAILADLPHLWDRVRRMTSAATLLGRPGTQHADQLLQQVIAEYGLSEVTAASRNAPECLYYERLREQEHDPARFALLWEYLDARVRFFFQALQPSFYYSDLLFGMPHVTHQVEQTTRDRTITIAYTPGVSGASAARIDAIWQQIRGWIDEHLTPRDPERALLQANLPDQDSVRRTITSEYNQDVENILAGHHLRVRFEW